MGSPIKGLRKYNPKGFGSCWRPSILMGQLGRTCPPSCLALMMMYRKLLTRRLVESLCK